MNPPTAVPSTTTVGQLRRLYGADLAPDLAETAPVSRFLTLEGFTTVEEYLQVRRFRAQPTPTACQPPKSPNLLIREDIKAGAFT